MADLASSEKPYQSQTICTDRLKSGDLVVGSARAELAIAPPGLYVDNACYDDNMVSRTYGCTLVWWQTNPNNPEAFNPYYDWYVANRCIECDEPWNEPHNCLKTKEKHNGEGQDP